MRPFVHSFSTVFLLIVAGLLMTSERVAAAPIYSQVLPEEPIGAFTSINTATAQKIADNFIIDGSGPITVRSVQFLGGYTATNPPPSTPPLDTLPTDGFRVVFFENSGGSPGTTIDGGDFSMGATFGRSPTSGPLLNGFITPFKYAIDLGVGLTLQSGIDYWVAILNNPGPDYGWQWARANGEFDQTISSTRNDIVVGPWNVFTNGGMFFELSAHNIPEPQGMEILIVALITIVLKSDHWNQRSQVASSTLSQNL